MILNRSNLKTVETAFSALFKKAYKQFSQGQLNSIYTAAPSSTKTTEYGWLGSTTGFKEWVGDRVLQSLRQHSYSITNKAFENTVAVDRDEIEDDNIGVYSPVIDQIGADAANFASLLVGKLIKNGHLNTCYDGQFFFDTDHPVGNGVYSNDMGGAGTAWYLLAASQPIKPFIFQTRRDFDFVSMDGDDDELAFNRKTYRYGVDVRCNAGYGLWQQAVRSRQALDATSFNAAIAQMMGVLKDNGEPLNPMPSVLLVPPVLRDVALQVAKAQFNAAGASNINAGLVEVITSPWIL